MRSSVLENLDFQQLLSELEQISSLQVAAEASADWQESLERLRLEEEVVARLLAFGSNSSDGSRRLSSPQEGARLDALISSYSDRIARIESLKRANREESASLHKTREVAYSALSVYTRSGFERLSGENAP